MSTTSRALTGTAEHPVLTLDRTVAAREEELLSAVLDPARLARWYGHLEGHLAAVGDETAVQLSEDPADRARARLLTLEPGLLRLAWTWQDEPESVITARWHEDADGLTLHLDHAFAEPRHLAGYGGGWEQVLQALLRELGAAEADAPSDEEIEEQAAATWRHLAAHPVEVAVQLPAPPEEVWEQLASAEGVARWWWNQWQGVEVTADVRPGGSYRIAVPAQGITVSGEVLAVDPVSRLSGTWVWADEDGTSVDEAAEIRLRPDGEGTALTVRHTGPFDAGSDQPENYRQGWEFTLGQLESLLSP